MTLRNFVEDVTYRDIAEMQVFARRWRAEHRKHWFTAPKLSGFCLLMTRAVYEKIGNETGTGMKQGRGE